MSMLEDLAITYAGGSEAQHRLNAYCLAVLGAVIAAVLTRGKGELQRAPYFAFSSLLVLATEATQLVWLGSISALTGGYMWVLAAVDVVGDIIIGYFVGVIAMARSRDAFGHRGHAPLAFIPLANFVLLLKGSKRETTVNRITTVPLMTGGPGVLSGLVVLAAAVALSATLRTQFDRMAEQAGSDPAVQVASVEIIIRSQGLEVALARLASEVDAPRMIDVMTDLLRVEVDSTTLRYHYSVDTEADHLPGSLKQGLTGNMCADDVIRQIFRAGGAVEHVYSRLEGGEIGTVRITRRSCDF